MDRCRKVVCISARDGILRLGDGILRRGRQRLSEDAVVLGVERPAVEP